LDTKSEIDPYNTEKKASTDAFKGKIEFKDVWFRYPTRKTEWIFQGLNLTIQPNESIAIVGESGCGKSTFASLILRFYQPDFGTILIDDIDIKDYNVQELR
jgi:ATP-binding cassette, subfamily B (MDR/TAP), member 1